MHMKDNNLPDMYGVTEVSSPFTGDTSQNSNKENEPCQVYDKVVPCVDHQPSLNSVAPPAKVFKREIKRSNSKFY